MEGKRMLRRQMAAILTTPNTVCEGASGERPYRESVDRKGSHFEKVNNKAEGGDSVPSTGKTDWINLKRQFEYEAELE
ncbi:UNVERIFIED_CONTAM: hypothetical protein FKN15_026106 [Acipenser sinensis]